MIELNLNLVTRVLLSRVKYILNIFCLLPASHNSINTTSSLKFVLSETETRRYPCSGCVGHVQSTPLRPPRNAQNGSVSLMSRLPTCGGKRDYLLQGFANSLCGIPTPRSELYYRWRAASVYFIHTCRCYFSYWKSFQIYTAKRGKVHDLFYLYILGRDSKTLYPFLRKLRR